MLDGVQDATLQRHQRDEQQIGEGDARQLDGEGVFIGFGGKARRDDLEEPRHHRLAEEQEEQEGAEQDRQRLLGERLGGRAPVARDHPGEQRHEGGVERALGKQRAEHVGQALGDDERVVHRAGAEKRRQQDVANEAEDAKLARV